MDSFYYEITLIPKKEEYDMFINYLNFIYEEAIEESDNKIILRSEIAIDEVIDKLNNKFDFKYQITKKQNQDWIEIYKHNIKPILIKPFYIHPTWIEDKKEFINITLDPTLAFGSGEHETTSSCIKAIAKYVTKNNTLLDVGCGSGILGLCATKLGAKVSLCDTDELAIKNAKDNFLLNNANFEDIWIGSINNTKQKYDIIIANIVADILIMLKNDFIQHLNRDGMLVLSGILDKYENKVLQSFSTLTIVEKIYKNEWVTLILKEPNEPEQSNATK